MSVQKLSAPPAQPVSPVPRPAARHPAESGGGSTQATLAKIERMLADTLPVAHALKLDIDPRTHTVIGKVVNKSTGEVVRQIPSEEMVALIARSAQVNALLNKKV